MRIVLLAIMSFCLTDACSMSSKSSEASKEFEGSDEIPTESAPTTKSNYSALEFADCVVDSTALEIKATDANTIGTIYGQKERNGVVVSIGFYDNVERKLWKTFFHDIWIEKAGERYMIKKVDFDLWEEHTATELSVDGSFVLVYHEYDAPYGYDEEYKQIEKYDLSKLPHITKTNIEIDHCCKLWLIGNKLYYTQELIGEINGYDDYSYSFNCLLIDDIDNRHTIAKGFECVTVSADGRFALGYTYLHGKRVVAMLQTETSKLCLYVGINSLGNHTIYDAERQQFGVDCGDYIKYIKMPKEFPYSALEYKPTMPQENNIFWSKNEDIFSSQSK